MLDFFSRTLVSLKYWVLCNKQLRIERPDGLSFSTPIIYNHYLSDLRVDEDNYNTQVSRSDEWKCVVVNPGQSRKDQVQDNILFLLPYSIDHPKDTIIHKHSDILFNKAVLAAVVDISDLRQVFLSSRLEAPTIHLTFKVVTHPSLSMSFFVLAIVMVQVGLCGYLCRKVIDKASHNDPVYDDFTIVAADIRKFKNMTLKPKADCTICLDEFLPDEDVRILSCGHYYHPACVDRWLIGHSKYCPYCRKEIVITDRDTRPE